MYSSTIKLCLVWINAVLVASQLNDYSLFEEDNSTLSEEISTATTATTAAGRLERREILGVSTDCQRGPTSTPYQVATLASGLHVLCDTETDGGNWVIFQRRNSSNVDFYRRYSAYEEGFGDLKSNFWLGLRNLNNLCGENICQLRVDMKYKDTYYHATYDTFTVEKPSSGYRLHVNGYQLDKSNAGDSLSVHDMMVFSTYDTDRDQNSTVNCAMQHHGGFWFNGINGTCMTTDLNGAWYGIWPTGVYWKEVNWGQNSLDYTEMKLRQKTQ